MGIFTGFRNLLFRRKAMIQTAQNFEHLFSDENSLQKYDSIRIIKTKGTQQVQEFREHIVETTWKIVQSEDPFMAMRGVLLRSMENYISYSLFFDDEFSTRRQDLYQNLNQGSEQQNWTDEVSANMAMWSDAEGLVLRLLHLSMFEKPKRS